MKSMRMQSPCPDLSSLQKPANNTHLSLQTWERRRILYVRRLLLASNGKLHMVLVEVVRMAVVVDSIYSYNHSLSKYSREE